MAHRDREREARIVRLYGDKVPTKAIGAEYGISAERVRQLLRQAGVAMRRPGRHKRKG